MKIGTSTGEMLNFYGDEEGIRHLAKAGFDCLDFGMFYSEDDWRLHLENDEFISYYNRLYEVVRECGISVGQVHSPMVNYLYTGYEEEGNFYFDLQRKAILAAECLHSPYIIIHPVIPPQYRYSFYREETREINRKYFGKLKKYLHESNVRVGIENMWNWDPEKECICPTVCSTAEEMCEYIDELGADTAVACLDFGHALLTGDTPAHMISVLGERLKTVHIHDNNGKEDAHVAPFMGIANWKETCEALKAVNYQGTFNFEADSFNSMFGKELADAAAEMLCKIGRSLVAQYEL